MSYQVRKNSLHAAQNEAHQAKVDEQQVILNSEMRKYQREQIIKRQNLEKVLLAEVRDLVLHEEISQ